MKTWTLSITPHTDYSGKLLEFEELLCQAPKLVLVKISGTFILQVPYALAFFGVAQCRPPATRIVTNAYSGLQGSGALLLWLMGDYRIMEPNSHFFIPRNEVIMQVLPSGEVDDPYQPYMEKQFDTIRSLINRYVSHDQIVGQPLGSKEMSDYLLLPSDLDTYLETIGVGEAF